MVIKQLEIAVNGLIALHMKISERIEGRFGVASGTLFLIAATSFIKVIGFLYKVPLIKALGSFGMGLYQTVFPVFTLFITVCCGGVPSAITKLIASGENKVQVLKKSLFIFGGVGLFLSLILFLLGGKISELQGNALAKDYYHVISPSIFLVSIIACFRGYFQGCSNLKPTAITQILEQLVKVTLGISFFYLVDGNYVRKGFFACLAVTLSELVALGYIIFLYLSKRGLKQTPEQTTSVKKILKFVLPSTAVLLFLPLASFIDSITAVNELRTCVGDCATDLYGIYSGGIEALISFPVSVFQSMAIGFLPKISTVNSESKAQKLLAITAVLSFITLILFQIFPLLITKILFRGFASYTALLVRLIRISGVNVVLLSTLSATNLLLLSRGKQLFSLLSMGVGLAVKALINLTLICLPSVNVFGMVFSSASFYLTALLINLIYLNRKLKFFKINK